MEILRGSLIFLWALALAVVSMLQAEPIPHSNDEDLLTYLGETLG
ncbi:hypothetical protein X975_25708, partial [Stegodyphus mimosarum]